jgi:hypothetical protein
MRTSWIVGAVASVLWLGACSRETPNAPPATVVVVPAPAASAASFPTGPASDPSLPSASVVASRPAGGTPASSPPTPVGSADAAASGASRP